MLLAKLMRRWRWLKLWCQGADICWDIQSQSNFFTGVAKGFHCNAGVWIADGVKILIGGKREKSGYLSIGKSVFLNHYVIIDCHKEIVIGDQVMIGPHTYICDFDHNIGQDTKVTGDSDNICDSVIIESNVWIGANVSILKGVRIGAGTIIGAGSVVVHDIPKFSIAVGVPAKVKKKLH